MTEPWFCRLDRLCLHPTACPDLPGWTSQRSRPGTSQHLPHPQMGKRVTSPPASPPELTGPFWMYKDKLEDAALTVEAGTAHPTSTARPSRLFTPAFHTRIRTRTQEHTGTRCACVCAPHT